MSSMDHPSAGDDCPTIEFLYDIAGGVAADALAAKKPRACAVSDAAAGG